MLTVASFQKEWEHLEACTLYENEGAGITKPGAALAYLAWAGPCIKPGVPAPGAEAAAIGVEGLLLDGTPIGKPDTGA